MFASYLRSHTHPMNCRFLVARHFLSLSLSFSLKIIFLDGFVLFFRPTLKKWFFLLLPILFIFPNEKTNALFSEIYGMFCFPRLVKQENRILTTIRIKNVCVKEVASPGGSRLGSEICRRDEDQGRNSFAGFIKNEGLNKEVSRSLTVFQSLITVYILKV